MKTIIIDAPRPEDVSDIQTVFYKTWLATYPNEEAGITREDIEDKFKDAFSEETLQKRRESMSKFPDNIQVRVARDGDRVVGISRSVKRSDVNQLQTIYVLPEYQGQGIGHMFWKESLQFFNDKKDIIVHVVTYNQPAIEFYKKLGFVDTGKRFTEERHMMKSGAFFPEMEMTFKRSKNPTVILFGVVSLILSRIFFLFINDPEGPNLLVVVGLVLIIFSLCYGILYLWKRNKLS